MRSKKLLSKYHVLCKTLNMDADNKAVILQQYGVESSKDLTDYQLIDIINKLTANVPTDHDKWRKRVIAVIGAWLRSINKPENIDEIKAIACRATGCNNFNSITVSKLRIVYNEFVNKNKIKETIDKQISEILVETSLLN